jgi:hypothetical protein
MAFTVRRRTGGHVAGMGLALVVLAAMGLAACSSFSDKIGDKIGDTLPAAAGGLPSGVPARPETAPDFVPVGDTPPPRDLKTLTEAERKKLEADLVTMRDRQEGKTPHPQEQASHSQQKTSHPQEKRTPSTPASAKVTDQAASR